MFTIGISELELEIKDIYWYFVFTSMVLQDRSQKALREIEGWQPIGLRFIIIQPLSEESHSF